jgi:hypothetical protein
MRGRDLRRKLVGRKYFPSKNFGWEAGIRPQAQLAEARRVEPKASCDVKESASGHLRGEAALVAGS